MACLLPNLVLWTWEIMASKKILNAGNLEALGAARLAGLLMEISEGNAVPKRRLRLELAGAENPTEPSGW